MLDFFNTSYLFQVPHLVCLVQDPRWELAPQWVGAPRRQWTGAIVIEVETEIGIIIEVDQEGVETGGADRGVKDKCANILFNMDGAHLVMTAGSCTQELMDPH